MEEMRIRDHIILPEPSHIGYVTKDIKKTMSDFKRYFGVGPFKEFNPSYSNKIYRGKHEDFKVHLAFCRAGKMVYELIQVIQGRTIYEEFMHEHGEGIHHLGYEIKNLSMWIKLYKKVGIEPIMSAERVGLKWAYFDTPGIIVELLERSPEGVIV